MSWANIKANIKANKLAIAVIRLYWYKTDSHTLVIRGFDTKGQYVYYNDPGDGRSHRETYYRIKKKHNNHGIWLSSIWNIHN